MSDAWSEQLQCCVRGLTYDFPLATAEIWMAEDSCTDMTGAIDMVTAIDPNAKTIITWAGKKRDTVYMKVEGEWKAFKG
jgi:hypothetical protein